MLLTWVLLWKRGALLISGFLMSTVAMGRAGPGAGGTERGVQNYKSQDGKGLKIYRGWADGIFSPPYLTDMVHHTVNPFRQRS